MPWTKKKKTQKRPESSVVISFSSASSRDLSENQLIQSLEEKRYKHLFSLSPEYLGRFFLSLLNSYDITELELYVQRMGSVTALHLFHFCKKAILRWSPSNLVRFTADFRKML